MNKSLDAFSQEVVHIMPFLMRGVLRVQKDAVARGKISLPQFLTLALLDTHKQLMMKDIARELGISLPAATGLISRLVKMNFVNRVFDSGDRRIVYIVLTAKGTKTIHEVASQRKRALADIFGRLTEGERRSYLMILRKVMKILYPEG